MSAVRSSFGTATAGLVLFSGGNCAADTNLCTQSRSLQGTLDGGQTFFSVAPIAGLDLDSTTQTTGPAKSPAPVARGGISVSPNSSYPIVDVQGFDACSLPLCRRCRRFTPAAPTGLPAFTSAATNLRAPADLLR